MPRPAKPIALIKAEGNKRCLTKAEIELREKAENELLTGDHYKEWPEVKKDPVAHKEFLRLRKAFKKIGKDDSLHENTINRYCVIHSECKEMEGTLKEIMSDIDATREMESMEEGLLAREKLYKALSNIDTKLMNKRKMMLDIEKENIMTIQSALRSIPKTPKEVKESPMGEFLKRKSGGADGSR